MQFQLTDEQAAALESSAAATGRPVTQVLREVVDAWRLNNDRRRRIDRAMTAVGGFRSGLDDVAEDHDEYLVQAIEERIGRR
jgi:ABC-type transporter Mla subunit MlaD